MLINSSAPCRRFVDAGEHGPEGDAAVDIVDVRLSAQRDTGACVTGVFLVNSQERLDKGTLLRRVVA